MAEHSVKQGEGKANQQHVDSRKARREVGRIELLLLPAQMKMRKNLAR